MNETVQIVLALVLLFAVMILAKKFRMGKMIGARDRILADLRKHGATTPEQAISLPYASTKKFRIGLRDERPRMLQQMVQYGIVGMTEQDTFYLKEEVLQAVQEQEE